MNEIMEQLKSVPAAEALQFVERYHISLNEVWWWWCFFCHCFVYHKFVCELLHGDVCVCACFCLLYSSSVCMVFMRLYLILASIAFTSNKISLPTLTAVLNIDSVVVSARSSSSICSRRAWHAFGLVGAIWCCKEWTMRQWLRAID